jgi:uncharacterized protein (DUF486 family)
MIVFLKPVALLLVSNIFMTTAWYWHLKYKHLPIPTVVLVSWGLAFVEYWLAIPANRMGAEVYSVAQLKTIQEVITLIVFVGFSIFYLGQSPSLNTAIGFVLIALGAFFVFRG